MEYIKKWYRENRVVIREWVDSIVIAFVLAIVIRTFVVQAFKIPSGSMRMTLIEGDRILVNKFIYRFREPKRGDAIVFKYPENPKKDFIKRLIATGGETVEIKSGRIYVDGEMVGDPSSMISRLYYYNRGQFGQEGKPLKVPDDAFYVLGDNSQSSRDSRYWGFVPKRNLVGKAFLIYWPFSRVKLIK